MKRRHAIWVVAAAVTIGLIVVVLRFSAQGNETEDVRVVVETSFVGDGPGESVMLLEPSDDGSLGDRITRWASDRGWTISDELDSEYRDFRPDWVEEEARKDSDDHVEIMWLGPAKAFLAEGSVEAQEVARSLRLMSIDPAGLVAVATLRFPGPAQA